MFDYEKYPLNAWVYGLSCLAIITMPIVYLVGSLFFQAEGEVFNFDFTGDFILNYLSLMLFPFEFSMNWLFQIPYLGVFFAIASYVIHLHVYSTIIERISVFLIGKRV